MLQISKEAIFYPKSVCLLLARPCVLFLGSLNGQLSQKSSDARVLAGSSLKLKLTGRVLLAQERNQARDVLSRVLACTQKKRQDSQMGDALRYQGLGRGGQVRGAGVQIGTEAGQAGLLRQNSLLYCFYGLAPERVSGAVGQQDHASPAGY